VIVTVRMIGRRPKESLSYLLLFFHTLLRELTMTLRTDPGLVVGPVLQQLSTGAKRGESEESRRSTRLQTEIDR
jgi:hypothetical protein